MKTTVNRPRKLVSLLLSLAMVLSLAIGFSGCGKTADLGDYVTIDVAGFSGAGTASANIDYDAFGQKYQVKEKLIKSLTKEYKKSGDSDSDIALGIGFVKLMDDGDAAEYLLEDELGLKTEFEKGTGLANGDQVVMNLSMNESDLKEVNGWLGVKIKYPTQITKTIGSDELPKATEIDVSSYIEKVKFKGPEGACTMNLGIANQQSTVGGFAVKTSNEDKSLTVTKDGHTDTYKYEIIKLNGEEEFGDITTNNYSWSNPQTYYSLKNGDVLVIGIKKDPDADAGYVLTNREKEVTVKALKPLIKTAEEVPMASLKADASKQLAKSTYFHKDKLSFKFFYQLDSSAEHINRILVRADGDYGGNDAMWLVIYDDVYEEDGTLKYNKDPDIVEMETYDFAPKDFNKEFQKYLDTDSYKITDIK